jgi:hypothetical protein
MTDSGDGRCGWNGGVIAWLHKIKMQNKHKEN